MCSIMKENVSGPISCLFVHEVSIFFFFFLNIHWEEGLGMENIFFIIVMIVSKTIHEISALWKGNMALGIFINSCSKSIICSGPWILYSIPFLLG